MGFFQSAFNAMADVGNAMNHGVNSMIGKDVIGDIRKIEDPKEFADYSSFPEYEVPEPEQWGPKTSEEKTFTIEGNSFTIPANLDMCMQYKKQFNECAEYYTERFKFKYNNCVTDFDSFVNYFQSMYAEGLIPMIQRATSLFLPLGIFDGDTNSFLYLHMETYHRAYKSFEIMTGLEVSQNQRAEAMGNALGNSVSFSGGGFGMKGAAKGMATAGALNLGVSALGKLAAHQSRMTQEQKAEAMSKFKVDLFFEEVKSDYINTFYSLVKSLSDRNMIGNMTTILTKEQQNITNNLTNPMFPQDQYVSTIVNRLIAVNPFMPAHYDLLIKKCGETEEIIAAKNYFIGERIDA